MQPQSSKIPRTCQHCGTLFAAFPYAIHRGGGRFCSRLCYNAWRVNLSDRLIAIRFWAHVDKTASCWLWTAHATSTGYGSFVVRGQRYAAHRYAWYLTYGEWPTSEVLDHLCRQRLCVRPSHLDPTTNRINVLRGVGATAVNARKTHCPNGHPYDDENTRRYRPDQRRCHACMPSYAQTERARDPAYAPTAKRLVPDDVRAIRTEHESGSTPRELALRWGVSLWVIYGVLERRTYRHVS